MKTAQKPKPVTKRERKSYQQYPAKTKCEAVLSVWSQQSRPATVCQSLGINWGVLKKWQNQAIEGMLQALEPKRKEDPTTTPRLNPKLQKLLEQKATQRTQRMTRLEKRLADIMETKQNAPEKKG